jgi:hypothetical protein
MKRLPLEPQQKSLVLLQTQYFCKTSPISVVNVFPLVVAWQHCTLNDARPSQWLSLIHLTNTNYEKASIGTTTKIISTFANTVFLENISNFSCECVSTGSGLAIFYFEWCKNITMGKFNTSDLYKLWKGFYWNHNNNH